MIKKTPVPYELWKNQISGHQLPANELRNCELLCNLRDEGSERSAESGRSAVSERYSQVSGKLLIRASISITR